MDYNYQKLTLILKNKLVMSQEEYAKLLCVSFASVNRYENGHHEPTINVKKKIIQLCKKNKIELVMEEE